jgi:hypothetical protein
MFHRKAVFEPKKRAFANMVKSPQTKTATPSMKKGWPKTPRNKDLRVQ